MPEQELSEAQIVEAARELVRARFVGVLSTVDEQGRPWSRFMSAVLDPDDPNRLLSVSARGARKLDQLAADEHVCWLFSDERHEEVATFYGVAQTFEHDTEASPLWQRLREASHPYAMDVLSDPENLWFVAMETTVQRIEYLAPAKDLTHPVSVKP